MNDLETSEKPFSLWRRLLWVAGVPALALLIIVLGIFGYRASRDAGELAEVLRALDETDPGWRLDEIEADRILPSAKENSAALCRELVPLLGPRWPDPKLDDHFRRTPLGERLDAQREVILEDEMARIASVRSIARKMVSLPRGRHKLEYELDPYSTPMPGQEDTRKVATLFDYESRYRANRGEVSEAVRAGRACVCVARSLYDEPTTTSLLVRVGLVALGLRGVERSLALGESNDAELAALDALLADEGSQNIYLGGLRGQRAMIYLLYKRIVSGELEPDLVVDEDKGIGRVFSSPRRAVARRLPGMLRSMNRAVDIARLPSHGQAAAEEALSKELDAERKADNMLILTSLRAGPACRRHAAQVAAMRGLIAVERFRMKHGKWPAKLAGVVPEFLKELPADPFDGKPMKMARVADGVIVYSVGPDGVDDGGKLNRDRPADAEGIDIGYQLWDVAKRRRPASPLAPEEKGP